MQPSRLPIARDLAMQSEFSGAASNAIGFREFVAMAAALMATQAIAVDTMLPALPTIAAALGLLNENHSQWIVTAYVVGVGCGQLFWGLFSDRYGRRPVLLIGLAVYASPRC
jgi:DHA1 family bicyclomycin/chloramphenicol resistance-like MFS transporter